MTSSTSRKKKVRSAAAAGAPARLPSWIPACLLIVSGLLTYSTSFAGVFMGDDLDALVFNENIRTLWPPTTTVVAPPDSTLAGRPIASLTFALNYAMSPGQGVPQSTPRADARAGSPPHENVWGFHAVNLAIHLLAALALFGVVRRTLLVPVLRERFGGASTALAFAIALIWTVHPLQAASVTFIVQRVEALMSLFFLTTLYCSIRAAESEFQHRGWLVAAIAACALGMGTKEIMAGAPIIVVAWLWLCRPDLTLWGPPRTLLVSLMSTWAIVAALAATGARTRSVGFDLAGWTWWQYLTTQAEVIGHYLWLVFWPTPLVFIYAWPQAESFASVLPQFVLIAALAVATGVALIRRRQVSLLGLWFFVILAPSSSVLPIVTEVAAEHRMYLPLAAVVAFLVLGAYAAARRLAGDSSPSPAWKNWSRAGWVALALVTIAFGARTYARNQDYASSEIMTAKNAVARPRDAPVQLLRGTHLFERGQFTDAESTLRHALTLPLPPGSGPETTALIHAYLGGTLNAQQRFPEAIGHLERSLAITPDLLHAIGWIGEALLAERRPREAVAHFERAIALTPDLPQVLSRTAWILSASSDASVRNGTRAVEYAERAVRLTNATDVTALDTLAAAYAETGQFDQALTTLRHAIDLDARSGQSRLTATLRTHLGLFEARQPVRMTIW